MEYEQQKAAEIAEKFGLSEKTVRVWKTRGKIPARYLDEEYTPRRAPDKPHEVERYRRGMQVLRSPKLNRAELIRRAGASIQHFADAMREENDPRYVKLSYKEFISVVKELQRLRLSLKNVVEGLAGRERFTEHEKRAIDEVIRDPALVMAQVLNYNHRTEPSGTPLRLTYERISGRARGANSVHEDFEVTIKVDRLSIFLIETAI